MDLARAPALTRAAHPSKATLALSLGALGVVFGDLGTSPLYALQEAFAGPHAAAVSDDNVIGVVSLFLWSLVLVVSIKYVGFLMRADNGGEGGILALLALARAALGRRARTAVVIAGLIGAALLYGDGVITPAISVLSAVEGLVVASPSLDWLVIPATLVILVGLFMVQRYGSARVGRLFGPVLALWFIAIGVLGAIAIPRDPRILAALDPLRGVDYFSRHGFAGVPVLGAVVLCLTGGEALYADMGHFGARPIRVAWFALALPALVLSYLGQGALLLDQPAAASRPFYSAVPGPLLYPMIALATASTVIASQALISAVFSLTRQAVQLGYWPRVRVIHTSADEQGQVYVPGFNWTVMLATLALVLAFKSSQALAGAFGLAVAGTMTITTLLYAVVVRTRWGWPALAIAAFLAVFLAIDLGFVGANLLKVADGGWLPLAIGVGMFTLMLVWSRGRELLRVRLAARSFSLPAFLDSFGLDPPVRVPGTAVFLTGSPDAAPLALLHYLKHAKSLHEQVVVLSVLTEDIPHVAPGDRTTVEQSAHGFWRVTGRYGFMESPDVPALLEAAEAKGLRIGARTYFLGRETVVGARGRWRRWRHVVFAVMHRNARPAADFFGLPANQVMEVGAQIEL